MARTPRPARSRFPTPGTIVGLTGTGLLYGGLWLYAPTVAVTLYVLEAALAAIVILTAVFGRRGYSERAFRLLRRTSPARSDHGTRS
ncbi:hypothetical protein [Nocardia salmonicida]|uniref:hypothetical protein n=1 Tax=Nocardia salmonicida TaxID=53431 RepID=UPI00363E0033